MHAIHLKFDGNYFIRSVLYFPDELTWQATRFMSNWKSFQFKSDRYEPHQIYIFFLNQVFTA